MENNFSYGMELELSDIDSSIDIPDILGYWEGSKVNGYNQSSETEVINTLGINRGLAIDPLRETCTVGGEINVFPTVGIKAQYVRIQEILELFPEKNPNHISNTHLHVHIPELMDFETLRRFTKYCLMNQKEAIHLTYYIEPKENAQYMKETEHYYYHNYDRKLLNFLMVEVNECRNMEDLKDLFLNNTVLYPNHHIKNNTSGTKRADINLYNLINNKTVEFRMFRSTCNMKEILSILMFVERFCTEAISETPTHLVDWVKEYRFSFPQVPFDEELHQGYINTKHSNSRGFDIKYTKVSFQKPHNYTTSDDYSNIVRDYENYRAELLK